MLFWLHEVFTCAISQKHIGTRCLAWPNCFYHNIQVHVLPDKDLGIG